MTTSWSSWALAVMPVPDGEGPIGSIETGLSAAKLDEGCLARAMR